MTRDELKAFVRKYMLEDIVRDFDDFLNEATAEELSTLYKELVRVNDQAREEASRLVAAMKAQRETAGAQASASAPQAAAVAGGGVRWD